MTSSEAASCVGGRGRVELCFVGDAMRFDGMRLVTVSIGKDDEGGRGASESSSSRLIRIPIRCRLLYTDRSQSVATRQRPDS